MKEEGVFDRLLGDGTFFIAITGLALMFAGSFAVFLCATGHFLPHDIQFLGLNPEDLLKFYDGRIVSFMYHDRVAFGGSIMAVGALYLWLAGFPLRDKQPWSWWVLLVSAVLGFGSFLTYLGYGYLDIWHAIGTLSLILVFFTGMIRAARLLKIKITLRDIVKQIQPLSPFTSGSLNPQLAGKSVLLFTGVGMVLAGITIMVVGMTTVFVPEDLMFICANRESVAAVSSKLIPLIAHDRAGFGGGLASTGFTLVLILLYSPMSKSLKQTIFFAGMTGFGLAIGVHLIVGYTIFIHLFPACMGACMFLIGSGLTWYPGKTV